MYGIIWFNTYSIWYTTTHYRTIFVFSCFNCYQYSPLQSTGRLQSPYWPSPDLKAVVSEQGDIQQSTVINTGNCWQLYLLRLILWSLMFGSVLSCSLLPFPSFPPFSACFLVCQRSLAGAAVFVLFCLCSGLAKDFIWGCKQSNLISTSFVVLLTTAITWICALVTAESLVRWITVYWLLRTFK